MNRLEWSRKGKLSWVGYIGSVPVYSITKRDEQHYSAINMYHQLPIAPTLEKAKQLVWDHVGRWAKLN